MDWKTWSPFQSEDLKRICANMTLEEKATVVKRGGLYGVWVATTAAIPIGIAVAVQHTAVIVIAAILVAIHTACIPFWQRSQRRFLCKTKWAREQGISPEQLRLFRWSRKEDIAT